MIQIVHRRAVQMTHLLQKQNFVTYIYELKNLQELKDKILSQVE